MNVQRIKAGIVAAALTFAIAGLAAERLQAAVLTVNFDSLSASGSPVSGAALATYLAQFGLTITNVTPGTTVRVFDARDIYPDIQPIAPPSPFNIIIHDGSITAISYTLESIVPLDSFSMTRPLIHPGTTGIILPFWQATALDLAGNVVASVGEPLRSIFGPDLPAQTFTLTGANIKRIRIDGNAFSVAGLGAMPFDNLVLNQAVPEPSSLLLLGGGALCLAGTRAIRRRVGSKIH